jgi:hypothetical protein
MDNKARVYKYVSYYYNRMSKEELKSILLEALMFIDDESDLVSQLIDNEVCLFELEETITYKEWKHYLDKDN